MSNISNKLYEFGEFRLNEREKNLWQGDKLIQLPPKVFDTLLLLVQNAGSVVTKEEMFSVIWADSFVEESNLSQNIYTLRQLFGKENKFIETVPRKGYRFVGSVTRPTELADTSFSESSYEAVSSETLFEPKTRRFKPATLTSLGSLVVAAVFMLIGAVWYRSNNKPLIFSGPIELKSLTDNGTSRTPAISPDGKFVAFIDTTSQKPILRLMDIESGRNVDIKMEGNHVPGELAFSKDGKELFFRASGPVRAGRKVFRIPYFGGYPQQVADNVWGGFCLSPAGDKMAFFRHDPKDGRDQLIVRDIATGQENIVSSLAVPEQYFMMVAPTWSPDGALLAALRRETGPNRSVIHTIDTENGDEGTINTELEKIFQIAWAPNSSSIYALSKEPEKGRQLWLVDIYNGSSSRITNDLQSYDGLSMSADGSMIVTEALQISTNVWLYPKADVTAGKALTSGSYGQNGFVNLAYATTGRIVFDTRAKVNRELWGIDIANNIKTRLLEASGPRNTQITTSADGLHIYFSSNDEGAGGIWRTDRDGALPTRITMAGKEEIHAFPKLSTDQTSLYFVVQKSGNSEIRKLDLKTSAVENIYTAENFSLLHFLEVSPDGTALAFALDRNNEKKQTDTQHPESAVPSGINIGIINVNGEPLLQEFTLKTSRPFIKFSNGGRSIDYALADSIKRADLAEFEREHRTVFSTGGERIFNFDWSMDGVDLTVAKGGSAGDIVLLKLGQPR